MIVRVCCYCERETGPQPIAPGQQKSHGACKRHAIEAAMDFVRELEGRPADSFCPDLAEQSELLGAKGGGQ